MKTKTHARTAPAIALRRITAVTAVLLTLCLVFMMPVGGAERPADLPTATVKELADGEGPTDFDLTFGLTFTATEPDDVDSTYDNWYADYYLTLNYDITANADIIENKDITADGYLAGSYDFYQEGAWLPVPFGLDNGYTLSANTPLPVMKTAAELMEIRDLQVTYEFVRTLVSTFNCGMYLTDEYMMDKPNLEVILELKLINPVDSSVSYEITRHVFHPPFYNVTFVDHKGNELFKIHQLRGTSITQPSNPEIRGYEFLGWDKTIPSVMPEEEVRITAQVKAKEYSITFNSMGGLESFEPTTVTFDSAYGDLPTPTRDGYTFAGWYTAETDGERVTEKDIVNIAEDHTLYAKWTAIPYNISVEGGSATPNPATIGQEITLTQNNKDGYVFKEWNVKSGDIEITDNKFSMPASNVKIFAVFDKERNAGEEIKPEISVDIVVSGDTTTIKTDTSTETEPTTTIGLKGENKQTVVITDKETGVQINVKFTDVPVVENGGYKGDVQSVSINYPEAPAEVEGSNEIKQTVLFNLDSSVNLDELNNIEFPSIDSEKKPDVVEKVTKQEQRANVLAMITATNENIDEINPYIGTVKITFKVHADLIANTELLKAYHVKGNKADELPSENLKITHENGFYIIEITSSEKFSSYVLAEVQKTSSGNTGGSATDTGSGNYQYYPRDVPSSGIISFGTSKVVTGMELPAGSDGKVTLNIKPTFAMPENGYYAFEIDAPGYNTDAKINGGLSFQIPVADLEAAGFTAEDIVLFHGTVGEDGKIVWEALPTNLVKNENGIAYYKAAISGCSPFYIGFVKDGSVINTEAVDPVTPPTGTPETPVTPDEPEILPPADEPQDKPTEEPATPAPLLAVLAGLGAVAVLRRK